MAVTEQGKSLSRGQRQLVGLVRAVLRRARIVCVDEATASVDADTDACLQDVLRDTCKHCTVITIAHRISTVLASDLVVVMDRGIVVEQGPPATLLANPNSKFSQLRNS